jgi:hypothetical protein
MCDEKILCAGYGASLESDGEKFSGFRQMMPGAL